MWYKTVTILTPVNNDERAPKDSDLISLDEAAHMASSEVQVFFKKKILLEKQKETETVE